MLNVFTVNTAHAKEDYFDRAIKCPVAAPVRTATATSLGEFDAFRSCTDKVVFTPPAPVITLPPFARIIGVKASSPAALKPEPEAQSPCRGRRCVTNFAPYGGSIPTGSPLFAPHRSASAYDGLIQQTASAYRIDPLFLHALTWTESAYRPTAISSAGARGLMQIMPGTGRGLGVTQEQLFDPHTNIDAGARYLKKLQRRYGRNIPLILAAYNAGEGAVQKYGNTIPPYRETQNYVRTVMQRYGSLRTATLFAEVVR